MELATRLTSHLNGRSPTKIYDLGCGPGNSTQILSDLFPGAALTGVDNSDEMLARARKEGPAMASWENQDLATWVPEDAPDIIFSNATYQWINEHEKLFPKLLDAVAPGGVLAIQMPTNFDAPSHVLLRKVAREGSWADKVAHVIRDAPVGPERFYYDLFAGKGTIDIWSTEYAQILQGEDPVLNWVSGTALTPFTTILQGAERDAFLAAYCDELRSAYPKSNDGTTLFPFKRLFMVVGKSL